MLTIENKSNSCVTVSARGHLPVVFARMGDKKTLTDEEYKPFTAVFSVYFQTGILALVKEPEAPAVIDPMFVEKPVVPAVEPVKKAIRKVKE